jgi:hypothetical protein
MKGPQGEQWLAVLDSMASDQREQWRAIITARRWWVKGNQTS